MSQTELAEYARKLQELKRKSGGDGPKNDDQLHAWILNNLGVDIPRTAVCEGHDAPFTFIADLYFERTSSALLMANRGGSKTFLVAILHLANALFKPGYESISIGAIMEQAKRCYSHLRGFINLGKFQDKIDDSLISETRYKNGSKTEIVPGTKAAVNGPHCPLVHVDEAELMDPDVFDESRNISQSKVIQGKLYKSIDVVTSTRKRAHGPMQALLDDIQAAKAEGMQPPYDLYVWCIFEAAAQVPGCQVANPDLTNPSGCEACMCDNVPKGRWDDGSVRTLKDVCKGRLHRSRGWIPYDDITSTFTKVTRDMWEAQQECQKPSTEGLVIPTFNQRDHGIIKYEPDPENGRIYMAVDWGGTNPHSAHWYQSLEVEVAVTDIYGQEKVLRPGSKVCFDEVYRANIGNMELADLVLQREAFWQSKYPTFKVTYRFPDVQNKGARLDWVKHDPPMKTSFFVTRQVDEHIKKCRELVEDDMFYVAIDRCEMFVNEIESWHYPEKKPGFKDDPDKPVDDFNHAMSDFRYAIANIVHLELKAGSLYGVPAATRRAYGPVEALDQQGRALPASTKSVRPGSRPLQSERWRQQFGHPATR